MGVIRIYDYLRVHRPLGILLFVVLTAALLLLLSRQTYKEDISDFLPLDSKYSQALNVYQHTSGASRIIALFQSSDGHVADTDSLVAAVDCFSRLVQERDTMGMVSQLTSTIDLERLSQTASFVYSNMPYFLTASDYVRFDSLLLSADYVADRVSACKQMLLFPVGGLLSDNVQRDPLNLFTPVVATLQRQQPSSVFENYDGYIFTPGMEHAIVMLQSPFGPSETSANGHLLDFLSACASQAMAECPGVEIHFAGGPVIAVGNARQIKTDSIVSVTLALVLIVGLLFSVFRRWRSLLLIVVSIGWGWLFAMGSLSLVHSGVSVIVIGISSVILGIAVNYPLHLIAHIKHIATDGSPVGPASTTASIGSPVGPASTASSPQPSDNIRQALREIATPLVVGNITTVGAFLALVPLESVALRDLGLFSSLLLVGTILFVLLFLPHTVGGNLRKPHTAPPSQEAPQQPHRAEERLLSPGGLGRRWVVAVVVVLTLVLGFFSLDTRFDSDMTHINYMTPQQRSDMEYFARLTGMVDTGTSDTVKRKPSQTVYVVSPASTADGAFSASSQLQPVLQRLRAQGVVSDIQGCHQFLCSEQEQQERLSLWHGFVARHGERMERELHQAAAAEGFADDTFNEFLDMLHKPFPLQPHSYFDELSQTVFAQNIVFPTTEVPLRSGSGLRSASYPYSVVDVLTVADGHNAAQVADSIERAALHSQYAFDVGGMNATVATRLSDNFNYIGWACGIIVFAFLWFSMGSIELAMLSFLPMAVSWLWILGVMSLLGIQFNVVNVILATFIFGQGDDYTIFMTEGCQYEYGRRRTMLAAYKQSILLSAAIMFIGIGTLIFARHPALRSLAEVTIVGMFSVVLMAWLLPPLIFRWLVCDARGSYRLRPLSLAGLVRRVSGEKVGSGKYYRHLVYDRYRYKGMEITRSVRRNLRRYERMDVVAQTSGRDTIVVVNSGWGELPMLLVLNHRRAHVIAIEGDADHRQVARYSFEGMSLSVDFAEEMPGVVERLADEHPGMALVLIAPTQKQQEAYCSLQPIVIV